MGGIASVWSKCGRCVLKMLARWKYSTHKTNLMALRNNAVTCRWIPTDWQSIRPAKGNKLNRKILEQERSKSGTREPVLRRDDARCRGQPSTPRSRIRSVIADSSKPPPTARRRRGSMRSLRSPFRKAKANAVHLRRCRAWCPPS